MSRDELKPRYVVGLCALTLWAVAYFYAWIGSPWLLPASHAAFALAYSWAWWVYPEMAARMRGVATGEEPRPSDE